MPPNRRKPRNVETHPYHRKAWKEQREKVLAPSCAWCGDIEGLCIHHTETRAGDWRALRNKVAHAEFLRQLPTYDATEPDASLTAFREFKKTHTGKR